MAVKLSSKNIGFAFCLTTLGLCYSAIFPHSATAISLTAGQTRILPEIISSSPDLAGTLVADTTQSFTLDFGSGQTTTGSIQQQVVRSNSTGTLDFYYRISNNASSVTPLLYFATANWQGFDIDVYAVNNSAGDKNFFLRADLTNDGGLLTADSGSYLNQLFPSESSNSLLVRTNAVEFNYQGIGLPSALLWTGSNAHHQRVTRKPMFGPSGIPLLNSPTTIPTPALLPGLIGMGVAVARKRKHTSISEG